MGSYSSGRCGGGPVAEDGWKLDLAHCMRQGMIIPGQHRSGSMTWTQSSTGKVVCSIGFEADLTDPIRSWVRLYYTTTSHRTGGKTVSDYRVRLETTRPPPAADVHGEGQAAHPRRNRSGRGDWRDRCDPPP